MKLVSILCSVVFFCLFISSVSAELFLWTDTIVNNQTQIVRQHGYYQFEDTSANLIGKNKPIEIIITTETEGLPFNATNNLSYGEVDYCNFTVVHYANEWNSDGNIVDTTREDTNVYFSNTPITSNTFTFDLRDRDSLIVDMDCHYTDVRSLYQESELIGKFITYSPEFECKGCEDQTLASISSEIERNENNSIEQTSIFSRIQNLITYNFKAWLIISWILKITFFLISIAFLVYGIFFFYNLSNELLRSVR